MQRSWHRIYKARLLEQNCLVTGCFAGRQARDRPVVLPAKVAAKAGRTASSPGRAEEERQLDERNSNRSSPVAGLREEKSAEEESRRLERNGAPPRGVPTAVNSHGLHSYMLLMLLEHLLCKQSHDDALAVTHGLWYRAPGTVARRAALASPHASTKGSASQSKVRARPTRSRLL